MGTLTLPDFRTELWQLLEHHEDADPSGGATITGRIDRWINYGYLRVSRPSTFRHMETETTTNLTLVTSTASYTLASTLWAIDHIAYSGQGYSLRRTIRREMSNRTLGDGRPTEYARWGRTVYVNPVPTSNENGDTLVVYGWLIPTVLSGTAATILTSHWDEPILEWAASVGWRNLGDTARADYHRENYAALVNDIREVLDEESRDTGGDFALDYVSIQDTMRRM